MKPLGILETPKDSLLCTHRFAKRLKRVIARLEADGLRPRIQDAWRSPEDQRRAFEAGHSKLLFGFHNVTAPDGTPQALAVDLLDDNAPLNAGRLYILQLAAAAQAEGLVTGVRWGVPKAMRDAIDAAIASGNWDAPVKVCWDPLHVAAIDEYVAHRNINFHGRRSIGTRAKPDQRPAPSVVLPFIGRHCASKASPRVHPRRGACNRRTP